VDEAGRGPLAGPVVAAAVILAPGSPIEGLDDSKRVAPAERERLFDLIREQAVAVGVGTADVATIDRVNILEATRLAMRGALAGLGVEPELVLTDYVTLRDLGCPQRNLVRGDQRSATVAAASIIAKVTRDRLMITLGAKHPGYGFERHMGYSVPEHFEALARLGPQAVLINVARGAVVDEAALVEALRAGRLAGAALDVYPVEPLPVTSPLWEMPNVILSPHVAGASGRYFEQATALFADNLQRYISDQPLLNLYDPQVGY